MSVRGLSSVQGSSAASGPGGARLFALVAFVVFVWGINWPMMKLALVDMPPVTFAVWRVAIAAVFFFAVFAVRGRLPLPGLRDWPMIASLAILQLAGTMGLVHIALAWVEPGRSAILSHTHPLWAVPLAVMFLGEKLSLARYLGLALGIGGIIVIFNPLTLDWGADGAILGHLLLIASAINLAIGMVHMRGHRWLSSPMEVMPWANLAATVLLAGLAFGFEGGATTHWTPRLVAILAFNGIFAGALGFLAYAHAAKAMPASKLALALLATPVLGLVASSLVIGEAITPVKIAGLALVSGGVALVTAGDFFRRTRRR